MILLNNVNVDVADPTSIFHGGGTPAILIVRGDNFGGGIVDVQIKSANDTLNRWSALSDGQFSSDGQINIDFLPLSIDLRATFTGSSGASNVYVEILNSIN